MNRITDTLYLGCYDDAICARVGGEGIRGTFNLAERLYDTSLPVRHMTIPDEVCLSASVWSTLVTKLHGFLCQHAPVLVHCRLGVSRSPALVAAYLAWSGVFLDPGIALKYVQTQRAVVNVHTETLRGITEWWSQCYEDTSAV